MVRRESDGTSALSSHSVLNGRFTTLENQHSVYFLVVLQHLFVSTTEVAAASILNGEINAFGLTNISVEFPT